MTERVAARGRPRVHHEMTSAPLIGVTCDVRVPRAHPEAYEFTLDHRYAKGVRQAGGHPVLLPISARADVIRRYALSIDALLIVGGDDVDPHLYGERPKPRTGVIFGPRLDFECKLYRAARHIDLPVMGICYGMQLINVLEGGALFQDIRRDAKSPRNHRDKRQPLQAIRIDEHSRLYSIVHHTHASVHCDHHQAVSRVAPGFRPVAFASDGIVEAIESDNERIIVLQWHPERMLRSEMTVRLFEHLISLANLSRENRRAQEG